MLRPRLELDIHPIKALECNLDLRLCLMGLTNSSSSFISVKHIKESCFGEPSRPSCNRINEAKRTYGGYKKWVPKSLLLLFEINYESHVIRVLMNIVNNSVLLFLFCIFFRSLRLIGHIIRCYYVPSTRSLIFSEVKLRASDLDKAKANCNSIGPTFIVRVADEMAASGHGCLGLHKLLLERALFHQCLPFDL